MNSSALTGPRYHASGYQMIRSIDIRNFRCYERLRIEECSRLNVIVGDNGSGKTALLEGIFLALASSTEVAMRLRQQRGLEGVFSGPRRRIEDAIWGDFFHDYSFKNPISIVLSGDGAEARSLVISRGKTEYFLPLSESEEAEISTSEPVVFTWKDSSGKEHQAIPKITSSGVEMPDTGEDMPDFFFFSANQNIASRENAGRFSDISRKKRHRQFVELFTKEYTWIDDISIEVSAGSPVLYATLKDFKEKIPLANVSGGINRVVGILLAIASRPRSVVLVDEMENGIYYKHRTAIWRGLFSFMREYDSQLFVTTHSQQWLESLVKSSADDLNDVSLWRLERSRKKIILHRFSGATLKAGIEYGQEVL